MRKIKTWIKFNESVIDTLYPDHAPHLNRFLANTRIPELEQYVVFSYSTNNENLIIGKIIDVQWKEIKVKVIESLSNTDEEHIGFFPKIGKNEIAEIETDNKKFNLFFTSELMINAYHKFKELKNEFELNQTGKKYNL